MYFPILFVMDTVEVQEKYFSNPDSFVCRAIYNGNHDVVLKAVKNTRRNKIECRLLCELKNSETSVNLIKHWEDSKYIYMILEHCDTDVLDLCVTKNKLSYRECMKMVSHITRCLIEMKKIGYSHRDVSLENILVKGDKYMLCDFGLSQSNKKNKKCHRYRPVGKRFYIAPELFDSTMQCDSYHLSKADVYSLGVCLYNVSVGQSFYINHQRKSNKSTMKILKNDRNLNKIDRNIRNLIKHMLRTCPTSRCTLEFVLNSSEQILSTYFLEDSKNRSLT